MLRRLRERAGFSQFELAERAGITRNALSDLERGLRRSPRRETLAALCSALALGERQEEVLRRALKEDRLTGPEVQGLAFEAIPPMFGRDVELDEAARFLGTREASVLVVTGGLGSGKSLFLRSIARLAHELGWTVRWYDPLDRWEDRGALLASVGPGKTVGSVLLVDDIDSLGGAALRQLSEQAADIVSRGGSLVVSALHLPADEEGYTSITRIVGRGAQRILRLGPLADEAIAALAATHGSLDRQSLRGASGLKDRPSRSCAGGVPLFVIAEAEASMEGAVGAITDREKRAWETLNERLPAGAIAVAVFCSLSPIELPAELLRLSLEELGLDARALESSLSAALAAGLVEVGQDGYRAAFLRLRRTVLASLMPDRSRAHRDAVIRGLARLDPAPDAGTVAGLLDELGEYGPFAEWAQLAASQAEADGDKARAKEWYGKVVARLREGGPSRRRTHRETLLRCSYALFEYQLADKEFALVEELANELVAELRAERRLPEQALCYEALMRSLYIRGEAEAAELMTRSYAAAAQNLPASAELVRFFSIRARVFYMLHDIDGMRLCFETMERLMPVPPDNQSLLLLYRAQMNLLGCAGEYAKVADILKNKLIPISEAINDSVDYLVNMLNLVALEQTLGEYREASANLEVIAGLLEGAAPHHVNFAEMLFLSNDLNIGNWDDLERRRLKATENEDLAFSQAVLFTKAEIAWYKGRYEESRSLSSRAERIKTKDGGFNELIPVFLDAEKAFFDGDAKRCVSVLSVLEDERWKDRTGIEDAKALFCAAKSIVAMGDADGEAAERTMADLDSYLQGAASTGARATLSHCHRYRAVVRYLSDRPDEARADARISLALERTMGRPYHSAIAILLLGSLGEAIPESDRDYCSRTLDSMGAAPFSVRIGVAMRPLEQQGPARP